MINKIIVLSVQVLSIIILEAASNLLQPEYSIKILNTENTVLSLGDVDNDDDLEIIKSPSDDTKMQEKLSKFHKYVNFMEMTERPKEKFYLSELKNTGPLFEMSYPDSPYAIAIDEKHLSELERRMESHRNKKLRRKKIKKSRHRGDFRKIMRHRVKMVPASPPDIEEQQAEYDYLEKAYLDYVAKSMNNNIAFKYSDEGKPEETVKDVVYKIVDIKTPRNCTNFRGIGIQAVECIVKNFRDNKLTKKQLTYSISIILLIWFCIYLMVAVPLWCSKGWCFCCCRCSFCFPRRTVRDIQKYIALNPPGVYVDSKGIKNEYVPTPKEIKLYERLRRKIADF